MISYYDIDGTRISCWVNTPTFTEKKRTLVFIHGSGGDHTVWVPQFSQLQNDYNIAAVELPGHGQSGGKGEQSVERYVEWINKLIGQFPVKKPVLIGHSLGAAISLTFAIKYPDRISGIVPVGGGVKMPVNPDILEGFRKDPAPILSMVAKFSVTKNNRERFSQILIDGMSKVNPDIIYGDFLSCNRLDLTEQVSQIRIPTLMICGDDDKMTPPALSQFLKDGIPGAQFALIAEAGHFVMLENPPAFNRALKDFVDALPPL